jgi:cytochrome c
MATLSLADGASSLFDAKCSMCHSKTRPTDMKSVIAPAISGVMRHVKMNYLSKDKAVEFMVDYVLNPSKDKAICMPQKIDRFGLMPSQKGNVTKEELESIASWLYDNYPPKGFKGGMHQGHGKGMMKGYKKGKYKYHNHGVYKGYGKGMMRGMHQGQSKGMGKSQGL